MTLNVRKTGVPRGVFTLPPLPPESRRAISAVATRWVNEYALTPSETRVFLATLVEPTRGREELAADLGLTLDTMKSHVKAILHRTGARYLSDLTAAVYREALVECVRPGMLR